MKEEIIRACKSCGDIECRAKREDFNQGEYEEEHREIIAGFRWVHCCAYWLPQKNTENDNATIKPSRAH